ncbi:MAG: ABC transporter permease [Balneola sp.]
MLKNYFKIAFRNLTKNKTFSFINVSGLTLGFSCFILISLFVLDELSFDRFHKDVDKTYRVVQTITEASGDTRNVATIAPTIGPNSKDQFPEVVDQTRLLQIGRLTVGNDPLKRDYEQIWIAGPNFFEFFDFEFLYGNPSTSLTGPSNLVITESTALKYFGKKDVLGESLYTNRFEATITGVIKDFPPNSHINMETIHTIETWAPLFDEGRWFTSNWTSNSIITYLKTASDFKKDDLEAKLTNLVTSNYSDEIEYSSSFWLQPLKDIHLQSAGIDGGLNANQGSNLYLYMFAIIGVLILVIACFNYMNLSTAAASKRTKEVGMRKTLGAGKSQLIMQYLGESIILSLVSLIIAITAVEFLLPYINNISGKALALPFDSIPLLIILLSVVLLSGILSALYPAIFLSKINPSKAFKTDIKLGSSGFSLKKVLVVAQFAISIGMIAATIIIYQQLNYINSKELGFSVDNKLVIDINSGPLRAKFESIKQEFEKLDAVKSVSVSSRVPGEWKVFPIANLETFENDNRSQSIFIGADEDFISTYDIQILEGRNLRNDPADSSSVLISKQAVAELDLTNPVGQRISINGTIWNGDLDDGDGYAPTIVGVVDNFHFESLHKSQKPVMIASYRNPIHNIDYYTLKIETNDWQKTIADLQAINYQFDPQNPVEYTFLDNRFEELYRADKMRGQLFLIFSGIVIFIACMGLFALASFTIESRIKEIGIRKVLGASVKDIVVMVCKDFVLLVAFGFVVATPIAWFGIEKWLTDFAYRININLSFFMLAGVIAIAIALITVSYHALKSAWINPVKTLRSE